MFLFHTSPYVLRIWKKSTNFSILKHKMVNTNRNGARKGAKRITLCLMTSNSNWAKVAEKQNCACAVANLRI